MSDQTKRLIRLRNVALAWAAQACGAVVMHCLGVVGLETVAAAIWFPGTTLLIVWIMSPNAEVWDGDPKAPPRQ